MPTQLYTADWIDDTLARLTDEIRADGSLGATPAIIGIRTRGAILAERLHARLSRDGETLPLGYIDTTMYRDDLHTGAGLKEIKSTQIDFDLNDRAVLLVDDVFSTGRTVRAALGALFDFGRPACIRLCVMLDRGGRELPLQADFLGAAVVVSPGGVVRLRLSEVDGRDTVYTLAADENEDSA